MDLLHLFDTKTVYTLGASRTVWIYKSELPIRNQDKDSLWATAVLLGASAFYRMDAHTALEAWPLTTSSSDGDDDADLAWLAMSEGKKSVWKLADVQGRRDSVFHATAEETNTWPAVDWELLPGEFQAAGLGASAVYRPAAAMVANLMRERCDRDSLLRFLSFLGCITPEFKRLLRAKDARALAILAMWYAKICEYEQWWIQRRARLEGQATCIYLETYYSHDAALMRLIEYPKII
ncbi:hypothetical protein DV736_g3515, partial [Chaetothyriales sp. CBS 134916]